MHVLLMVCFPIRHAFALKFDLFAFYKGTCKARADVIDNKSQQQIVLKCFATFVLFNHIFKVVFT